jgi:hypothetical protein
MPSTNRRKHVLNIGMPQRQMLLRTTTYIGSTMMRMTERYVVIRLVNDIQVDGKDLFQSL